MHLTWPPKLNTESLNYQLDWTDALAGKTISASAWTKLTTDNPLTLGTDTRSTTATEIRLSGGTAGYATLRNTITTNDGQTMIVDVKLLIRV